MWNLTKYVKNDDGNVAVMFALLVTMLGIVVGVGADYSNSVRLKNSLQSQVDAAVLAAATADVSGIKDDTGRGKEKKIRSEAAESVIKANGFSDQNRRPEITLTDSSVTVRAEIEYTPFFGKILGKEVMTISAESESGLGKIEPIEIVLALDNTNSMSVNGKMDALKAGAISLIDAVEDSNSDSKIGLVPFAKYVRVPDSAATEGWLDVPAEFVTPVPYTFATVVDEGTCASETRTRLEDGVEEEILVNVCEGRTYTFEVRDVDVTSKWENCVGTRPPPLSEEDGSYSTKVPGLLDRIPYTVAGTVLDVYARCPDEIQPMSTDYEGLRNAVNNLFPTDTTYIPSGLIWGQRVLSPGLPFDNQSDGEPKRQIMILMTDGENTTEIMQDATSVAAYKSPPYIGDVETDPIIAPEANAVTARLCSNLKADGIEIYTIAFQVDDANTQKLLRDCASAIDKAFTPDTNDALIREFEAISRSLSEEVRLIR